MQPMNVAVLITGIVKTKILINNSLILQHKAVEAVDDKTYLMELGKQLKEAERVGSGKELPEGIKIVWIKDELANALGDKLMEISDRM